jgi:hypothetical protein
MTVQELLDGAHEAATQLAPQQLAAELQAVLGQKLLAFALGDRHPKTIGRYARGERKPDDEALQRLVNLYMLAELLETRMRRQTVRSWMLGANPRLRGKAPIEVFHEGRFDEVQRAARSYIANR